MDTRFGSCVRKFILPFHFSYIESFDRCRLYITIEFVFAQSNANKIRKIVSRIIMERFILSKLLMYYTLLYYMLRKQVVCLYEFSMALQSMCTKQRTKKKQIRR